MNLEFDTIACSKTVLLCNKKYVLLAHTFSVYYKYVSWDAAFVSISDTYLIGPKFHMQ